MMDSKKVGELNYKIIQLNQRIGELEATIARYKRDSGKDSDISYVNDLTLEGLAYKESQLILQIKRVADGLAKLNCGVQKK